MRLLRFRTVTAAAVAVLALAPTTAGALIASVSGGVVQVAPPPSVRVGQFESASARAFNERQDVFLASSMAVDIVSPGTYNDPSQLSPSATIPTGAYVDSHLIHFDPPGTGPVTYSGSVTFHSDVLGLVVDIGRLGASDVLGAPGTLYPFGGSQRGLILSPTDTVTLSANKRTVSFALTTKQAIDQIRVITVGDATPTAEAGGPYAGTEGTGVVLAGTASDLEGPPAVSWGFTWTGDAGTACTASGTTTLTPTVTCDDDALVTATLTASDGISTDSSVASVTVGNVAPSVGALTGPLSPVARGANVAVSASFTDAGDNDTHTAVVAWGDTTSSAATLTPAGAGTNANATHAYATAGVYTVTMTVTDDDGGVASTSTQLIINAAPTADAGGPYSGLEGAPTGLAGTALDPDGDPLTTQWTHTPGSLDPGGACTSAGDTTLVPTVSCTDDAVVATDLSASDGINSPAVSSTSVIVQNEAPVLGTVAATAGPIAVGAPVSVAAPFTDAGTNDVHTATVDWGDLTTTNASITQSPGSGTLNGSHAYATAGLYTVTVTLYDDDLGWDTATASVLVNSAPTADAGGPYVGLEGAQLSIAGTAGDVDGDTLSVSWSFAVSGGPGTVCTPTGTGTLTPTLTCNDDATINATLTVSDGVNAPVTSTASIAVGNVAPVAGIAVPSSSLVPTGASVSVSVAFTDDGTNDAHSGSIDWGDGNTTAASVSETGGSGTVAGTHIYAAPGVYPITVTVSDDDGDVAVAGTVVTVNGQPTVGAGGPYAGVEGAPVTLSGTAVDPDADTLVVSWTHVINAADPGTVCTFDDATSLVASLTCDDDADVTVTLSADDGVNAPVLDDADVQVFNAAPSLATPSATPNPLVVGQTTTVSASFDDPGVNDTHVAVVQWGDATSSAGSITETDGAGTVSATHAYAAQGAYTATILLTDKDGAVTSATVVINVNGAPGIDAGGPYSTVEGTPVSLAGSATDPEGDPLGISWSIAWTGSAGTACTLTAPTSLTPSVVCDDDATVTATLEATDGVNAAQTDTATVQVANVAPSAGAVNVPMTPIPVGTPVTATTTFADAGMHDTHTATVDWDGVTTAGSVSESGGSGSVSATRVFPAAGTYTVTITVSDDDGGSVATTAEAYVVVYDPNGGFVTGGGYISSPSGAYTPDNPGDADRIGKANYGFNSKYQNGATVPSGQTEFQLKSAGMNFHSTGYAYLIVTGTKTQAYYTGTGKVNGTGNYEFVVSIVDGRTGNNGDTFRMKVRNLTTGVVLYDTDHGAAIDALATVPTLGGNIVIH